MEENRSRIIGDSELNLSEEGCDLMGTAKHVEQLYKILEALDDDNLKYGFNIGVFGGWGSGKSSILLSLGKKILNNNNERAVVSIDCWKYSENDLRRSLLLQMLKENPFDNGKDEDKRENNEENNKELCELENRLYKSTTIEEENSRISLKNLFYYFLFLLIPIVFRGLNCLFLCSNFFKILLLIISPASFILILLYQVFGEYLYYLYFGTGILTIINSLFEGISENLKGGITNKEKISITRDGVYSPEEFEKLFSQIVNGEHYFKGGKYKRIIFIFDNIDRCDENTVKKILTTIKTFLNSKKCIFLLPIDYKQVCKAFDKYEDGNEYLRKIFNLSIYLERSQPETLNKLIEYLLEKNNRNNKFGISDAEIQDISYVLSSVFADNPRKIKQFLNNLGAEFLLQNGSNLKFNNHDNKNTEGDETINGTHPILLSLKKLIIQQEIPYLFNYIVDNITFSGDIMKYLNSFGGSYRKYSEARKIIEEQKDKSGNTQSTDDNKFILENIPELLSRDLALLEKISTIEGALPLLGEKELFFQQNINSPELFLKGISSKNDEKLAINVIKSSITQVRDAPNYAKNIFKLFVYFSGKYGSNNVLFNHIFVPNSIFYSIIDDVTIPFDTEYLFYQNLSTNKIKQKKEILSKRCTTILLSDDSKKENIEKFSKLEEKKIQYLLDRKLIKETFEKMYNQELVNTEIEYLNIFSLFKIFPNYIDSDIQKMICSNFNLNSINDIGEQKIINRIRLLEILPNYLNINENNDFIKSLKIPFDKLIGQVNVKDKKLIENYFRALKIAILSSNSEKEILYKNLNKIYDSGIENIREKVVDFYKKILDICDNDVNYVIAFGIKIKEQSLIEKLLSKYLENKDLFENIGDPQIFELITRLKEDESHTMLYKKIIKNAKLSKIYLNGIKNDSFESMSSHISYIIKIDALKYCNKEFFYEIEDKIIQGYGKKQNPRFIISIFDFLIDNQEIVPYLKNRSKILELTENLVFDGGIYMQHFYNTYNDKKEKVITILSN